MLTHDLFKPKAKRFNLGIALKQGTVQRLLGLLRSCRLPAHAEMITNAMEQDSEAKKDCSTNTCSRNLCAGAGALESKTKRNCKRSKTELNWP